MTGVQFFLEGHYKMRAIFYSFTKENCSGNILVVDESARHLNVVRAKTGEEVLLLNGQGLSAITKIVSISKNQVELEVISSREAKPFHDINLAIATPKKDAFEDILKIAVELGVRKIYPLSSEFSQYEYNPGERIQRILESALIQSNNPYLPVISPQMELNSFIDQLKTPLYFFNSRPINRKSNDVSPDSKTILIGPEGGFSEREEANLLSNSNVISIHLPTPIQRAPTAVASCIGYLLHMS